MDKKLFTVNEAWEALGHTMSKAYLYKLIGPVSSLSTS